MKKLITAACATAFVLGTTLAFAEDSKMNAPTQKTPTQQQMDTKSTDKMKKPSTTGAGMNNNKPESSTLPGKPTDTVKDSLKK
jgi:hypothetical protein